MAVTNLTGYTWVGNSSLTISSSVSYSINGNGYFYEHQGQFDGTFNSIVLQPGVLDEVPASMKLDNSLVWVHGWDGPQPFTIEFTGGTDATNANLIAWLEANGTLTAPIQANTYTLTHTLTNLTKGNITLQITPDNGYSLPASSSDITVTNGTIVSYNNQTGVLVINGDDTTTISCECPTAPSGYSVTFTASNSWNGSSKAYIYIYDGSWMDPQNALLLLEQHPADKYAFPMTLQVSSGVCGINIHAIQIAGRIVSNDYNINDYTGLSPSYNNNIYIDKDGTINLDINDWAD